MALSIPSWSCVEGTMDVVVGGAGGGADGGGAGG